MKLDYAILANSSEIRENIAFMLGGSWDTAYSDRFPAQFSGSILIRLLFHQTETGREHQLELRVHDEDGRPIAPAATIALQVDTPKELPTGWEVPALAAINLRGLPIPKQGRYSFELLVDGLHLKSLPFRFLPQQPS